MKTLYANRPNFLPKKTSELLHHHRGEHQKVAAYLAGIDVTAQPCHTAGSNGTMTEASVMHVGASFLSPCMTDQLLANSRRVFGVSLQGQHSYDYGLLEKKLDYMHGLADDPRGDWFTRAMDHGALVDVSENWFALDQQLSIPESLQVLGVLGYRLSEAKQVAISPMASILMQYEFAQMMQDLSVFYQQQLESTEAVMQWIKGDELDLMSPNVVDHGFSNHYFGMQELVHNYWMVPGANMPMNPGFNNIAASLRDLQAKTRSLVLPHGLELGDQQLSEVLNILEREMAYEDLLGETTEDILGNPIFIERWIEQQGANLTQVELDDVKKGNHVVLYARRPKQNSADQDPLQVLQDGYDRYVDSGTIVQVQAVKETPSIVNPFLNTIEVEPYSDGVYTTDRETFADIQTEMRGRLGLHSAQGTSMELKRKDMYRPLTDPEMICAYTVPEGSHSMVCKGYHFEPNANGQYRRRAWFEKKRLIETEEVGALIRMQSPDHLDGGYKIIELIFLDENEVPVEKHEKRFKLELQKTPPAKASGTEEEGSQQSKAREQSHLPKRSSKTNMVYPWRKRR